MVGAEGHSARVGADDFGVAHAVGVVENLHAVDAATIGTLALHVNDVVVQVAVKHAFFDVEGQFLSAHVEEQGLPLEVGYGDEAVRRKKGEPAEQHRENNQGTHHFPHRDAGSFHGHQLVMFAEVAETHQ